MTRAGPLRCALVAEDECHRELAQEWTKRCVETKLTVWGGDVNAREVLEWVSDARGREYVKHTDIKNQTQARRRGPRARIRLTEKLDVEDDAALEAKMFVRALVWAEEHDVDIDVVLLARDLDSVPARQKGLERAREDRAWSFEVVGMLPQPEAEAWLIAGFEPTNDAERKRLKAVTKDLGFDPTEQPDRLKSTGGPKDAKPVAKKLLVDANVRARCLAASFERLRSVGSKAGIASFLDEVEQRVVPQV